MAQELGLLREIRPGGGTAPRSGLGDDSRQDHLRRTGRRARPGGAGRGGELRTRLRPGRMPHGAGHQPERQRHHPLARPLEEGRARWDDAAAGDHPQRRALHLRRRPRLLVAQLPLAPVAARPAHRAGPRRADRRRAARRRCMPISRPGTSMATASASRGIPSPCSPRPGGAWRRARRSRRGIRKKCSWSGAISRSARSANTSRSSPRSSRRAPFARARKTASG